MATWTGAQAIWQSLEFSDDGSGSRWTVRIPHGATAVIQVVDGAGNVAVADNAGALYGRN